MIQQNIWRIVVGNVSINTLLSIFFTTYAFTCEISSKLSGRFGRCEHLRVNLKKVDVSPRTQFLLDAQIISSKLSAVPFTTSPPLWYLFFDKYQTSETHQWTFHLIQNFDYTNFWEIVPFGNGHMQKGIFERNMLIITRRRFPRGILRHKLVRFVTSHFRGLNTAHLKFCENWNSVVQLPWYSLKD